MEFSADEEKKFYRRRDQLASEFEGWLPAAVAESVDSNDLAMLLDWKWGYGDGHLGRWRAADLSEFLLGWCPRKLLAPPELLASVPLAVTLAMAFLSDRGLMTRDSDPVESLTEHGANLIEPFREAMTDPANFGLAKSLFSSMGVSDASALDPEQLDQLVEEFNAMPMEARKAVTDPAMSQRGASAADEPVAVIGPVLMPDDDAIRTSAEASPAFQAFTTISEYFAPPGKILTAIGNLKLADARALVQLLGTEDEEEMTIGDTTWKRRSSTEFGELDHWQWWAREAGVVRTKHNRLVAVAAWRKRLGTEPVATLAHAIGTLFECGIVSTYGRISWQLELTLDVVAPALLGRLLRDGQAETFDDLLGVTKALLASLGADELYPGHASKTFEDLLTVLERAGLVTWEDTVRVERAVGSDRRDGTVTITAFGTYVAVQEARRAGIEVDVIPSDTDLTVTDLVALGTERRVEAGAWWNMAIRWLDTQPDQGHALEAVLVDLGSTDLLYFLLVLGNAPEPELPTLTPIVRRLADQPQPGHPETSALALHWLIEHKLVDDAIVDPDRLADAVLTTLEVVAEAEESIVIELLNEYGDAAKQVELLGIVVRRGRPRGLNLLELVGRSHADKTVSKFARKESFRLRSKLAAGSSSRE